MATHTRDEWEAQKDAIIEMYERFPAKDVAKMMRDQYNFSATKKQYQDKFKKWGLKKYKKRQDMKFIKTRVEERAALGKRSEITYAGKRLTEHEVDKLAETPKPLPAFPTGPGGGPSALGPPAGGQRLIAETPQYIQIRTPADSNSDIPTITPVAIDTKFLLPNSPTAYRASPASQVCPPSVHGPPSSTSDLASHSVSDLMTSHTHHNPDIVMIDDNTLGGEITGIGIPGDPTPLHMGITDSPRDHPRVHPSPQLDGTLSRTIYSGWECIPSYDTPSWERLLPQGIFSPESHNGEAIDQTIPDSDVPDTNYSDTHNFSPQARELVEDEVDHYLLLVTSVMSFTHQVIAAFADNKDQLPFGDERLLNSFNTCLASLKVTDKFAKYIQQLTLLHCASSMGMPRIVTDTLISLYREQQTHSRGTEVMTPLHIALYPLDLDFVHSLYVVKKLLDGGADVHALDFAGLTPVEFVLLFGLRQINGGGCSVNETRRILASIDFLRGAGANLNTCGRFQSLFHIILHFAGSWLKEGIDDRRTEMLVVISQYLLTRGADATRGKSVLSKPCFIAMDIGVPRDGEEGPAGWVAENRYRWRQLVECFRGAEGFALNGIGDYADFLRRQPSIGIEWNNTLDKFITGDYIFVEAGESRVSLSPKERRT